MVFTYTKIKGYSGQNNISLALTELFRMLSIITEEIHLKAFRAKVLREKLLIILCDYPCLAFKAIRFFFANRNTYISNLQQTTYAMVGFSISNWPLLLKKKNSFKLIITLHGSIFYKWPKNSVNFFLFRTWIKRADFITTLGPKMEESLINQYGVSRNKIFRLNNFSSIGMVKDEVKDKLLYNDTLQITYLSLFVEKKGYNEFLGAMKKLILGAFDGKVQINFLGKFVVTEECGPNHTIENLQNSIRELTAIAENDARVTLNINTNGVFGKEKNNALKNTHIFVLPTSYANEAQPISLIEAAAHGSALISGKTGEVPSMFPADAIVLLDEINSDNIYNAINELLINPSKRKSLALNAYHHSVGEYSREAFNRRWMELLDINPN